MYLELQNHNYKYAVEQMLITLFPHEKPVYSDRKNAEDDGSIRSHARSSLIVKDGFAICTTDIYCNGTRSSMEERSKTLPDDTRRREREIQKTVKMSFYKAALPIIGKNPPWGALTGIRPAKLLCRYVEERGVSFDEARELFCDEYFVSPDRAKLAQYAAKAAYAMKKRLAPNDVSLYAAIPFCPSRCAYCSFVSRSVEKDFKLVEPYLEALLTEIDRTAALIKSLGLRVVTIYIGGGTPTTLPSSRLSRLLDKITRSIDTSALMEFCVEAGRPDTISADKLTALKSAGVTRISINPQSMNAHVLEKIGRKHSTDDVYKAFDLARKKGFHWINADLIAGLPGDGAESFAESLNRVIELSPENITVHNLSIKRGSNLNEAGAEMPSAETVGRMLCASAEILRKADYEPYYLYRQKYTAGGFENTGWSRPGFESAYNICMMEDLHSIIAVGAGAVTKLCGNSSGRIERVFNKKYAYDYIKSISEDAAETERKIRAFMGEKFDEI